MASPEPEESAPPFRWRRLIKPAVTVAVVAALSYGLRSLLATFSYDEVIAGLDQISTVRIVVATLMVATIHGLFIVRERVAVDFAGFPRLATRKVAVASLISRSLSTLGVATVTGFALRIRLYQDLGLDTRAVGRITVYNESTYYVGIAASLALVFTLAGLPPVVASSFPVPPLDWLGPAAIALLVVYAVWNLRRHAPLRIRSFELPPLTAGQLVAQLVLPVLDTLATGYATYALLPASSGLSYLAVVTVGLVASVVGSISQVPGGLGVYETTVLAFVPPAAHPAALAALLVRRAIVNLLPIAAGAMLLVGVSVGSRLARRPSRVALDFGRDAVAIATFAASVLSLIASVVPRAHGLTDRIGPLAQVAVFAAGLATLVAARGLQQGRRRAWWVCVTLFALRTVTAIIGGPHVPSLIIAGTMLLVLVVGAHLFKHPGPLFDGEPTWWTAWLVALIGIAWVVDAQPDTLTTEVRARATGVIVAAAVLIGGALRRILPERRRRRRKPKG
ncbi:MAG: hypothetical protein IPL61_24405 [Myxococcales bacterium]|nr:hypothetical protein [Myxococcales bacterium]